MNYCKINGISFDTTVAISDYDEYLNVLDGDNVGRAKGTGRMIRDVIGAYIGHKITFFSNGNNANFDALWEYLKIHSVDDSVMLEAVDGQTTLAYEAYYTALDHKLREVVNGVNHWDSIEVNFIPIYPQITP